MARRKLTKTKGRTPELSEGEWLFLIDQVEESRKLLNPFFMIELEYQEGSARPLWDGNREAVLEYWVREHAGTRPSLWWKFDAPRQALGTFPDCYYDGKLPEPRQKLSGAGFPAWEELYNIVPAYDLGIPSCWTGVDLKDLPCFESEAAYLKRHGLLASAEKRKLRRGDFETATEVEYDPDDYPDRPWREVAKERILARVAAGEETADHATALLAGLNR